MTSTGHKLTRPNRSAAWKAKINHWQEDVRHSVRLSLTPKGDCSKNGASALCQVKYFLNAAGNNKVFGFLNEFLVYLVCEKKIDEVQYKTAISMTYVCLVTCRSILVAT